MHHDQPQRATGRRAGLREFLLVIASDIFLAPKIGLVTAWAILIWALFIYYLTWNFAPTPPHLEGDAADVYLHPIVGYWAMGNIVTILLFFAFLPRFSELFRAQTIAVPSRRIWILRLLNPLRWPSFVLSAADTMLVRIMSVAVGASIDSGLYRNLAFGLCMLAFVGLSIMDWPTGPFGACMGTLVTFAVMRRWDWIEESKLDSTKSLNLIELAAFAAIFQTFFVVVMLRNFDEAFAGFDYPDMREPPLLEWFGFLGSHMVSLLLPSGVADAFNIKSASPIEVGTTAGAVAVFLFLWWLTQLVAFIVRLIERALASVR